MKNLESDIRNAVRAVIRATPRCDHVKPLRRINLRSKSISVREGHRIKVYSLAKTIADCFKFRNRIGIDPARDALKVAVTEKGIKLKEIMQYAKICRVDSIVKPILEALI